MTATPVQPTSVPGAGRPIAVVGLFGGRPVGADAETAVRTATLVAGSVDHLAATADLRRADATTTVVRGGLGALDDVIAHDGPACVLASGDPGFFGVARSLRTRLATSDAGTASGEADPAATPLAPARSGLVAGPASTAPSITGVDPHATRSDPSTALADRRRRTVVVHPAPSSVALAFARAGVSWDGAVVRSCHTGLDECGLAEVAAAPVAAVLCGPDAPPEAVAAALLAHGAHHPLAVVAAHLAEPAEEVTVGDLCTIATGAFPHRAVLVVAHPQSPVAPTLSLGGRPVDAFAHRAGMITKPEVRSVVLGKLHLPAAGVLWDLGAGSASVAIEVALAAPGLRVIAVESNGPDADRAVANAAAFGAPVQIVHGAAPGALADLPDPDRVFVGGGGLDVLDAAWARLRPGGRLVATFAAVDRAAEAHRRLGSLVQVSVDRADTLPDGGVRFAADNPVFVAWGHKPRAGSTDRAGLSRDSIGEPVGRVHGPGVTVSVGVGCSSHATVAEVESVVREALEMAPAEAQVATVLATVDRRREHPAILPALGGAVPSGKRTSQADADPEEPHVPVLSGDRPQQGDAGPEELRLVWFPSSVLATVGVPTPSDPVADAVGTPSVAEAAALLAAGPGARLVVPKHKGLAATAAVAIGAGSGDVGQVTVVGLGPGAAVHRTPAAVLAVRSADAVVGYGAYVDAVAGLLRPEQMIVRSAMGAEADRAAVATSLAVAGWRVALVSSGDAGVFAMASTAIEAASERTTPDGAPLPVHVVPGVTAAHAGAAAVGAPLAGAHVVLTLSDILVPWERIEGQLRGAAGSGMALALYNPRSKGRPEHLSRALAVLGEVLSPETAVAIVTAAGDNDEQVHTATLATVDPSAASMRSVVLVGTADTTVDAVGRMVTSRHHPPSEGLAPSDGTEP